MKENLREAKKELFIARRNSILAIIKAGTLLTLAAFGPSCLVGGLGGITIKKMKEQTKVVPYVEEVLVNNKGEEQVNEVKEEEKGSCFYKVFKDCSPLDGKYVVSYELYTGDDITYENLDIVNSYKVPANKVFKNKVTGIETVDNPVDKGYSIARVYRIADKTYERPIQKGDKEYDKVTIFTIINSISIGALSYYCPKKAFFNENSISERLIEGLNVNDYEKDVERKKEKVKRLKKESKEE